VAPKFDAVIRREVRNVRTGAAHVLQRADAIQPTGQNLADIVRICNEPLLYSSLFAEGLAGKPYPREKAVSFLTWAADGWRAGTHFAFLVTTAGGRVAAAIDIKGARLDGSEVGYWCSAEHSGLMTPTLAVLCDLARAAGFTDLYARTKIANVRSQAVLLRNGFVLDPAAPEAGERHFVFRRSIGDRA